MSQNSTNKKQLNTNDKDYLDQAEEALKKFHQLEKLESDIDMMMLKELLELEDKVDKLTPKQVFDIVGFLHVSLIMTRQKIDWRNHASELMIGSLYEMIKELGDTTSSLQKDGKKIQALAKRVELMRLEDAKFNERYEKMDFIVEGISTILKARGINLTDIMQKTNRDATTK
jgi:hypothetical protein